MTYICPRPECDRTSDVLTYCRHGIAPDLAPGNWMLPEGDPTVMDRGAKEAMAFAREVEDTMLALVHFAASDSRQWIRDFEFRTLAAPGKSMRAINLAYKKLLTSGDLELDPAGEHVRLRNRQALQRGQG